MAAPIGPWLLRWRWPLQVIATCALAVATIVSCNQVARTNGHLPAWLWAPAISFTGALYPERYLYVAGFTLVGLSFLSMAAQFNALSAPVVEPRHQRLLQRGLWSATLSFTCLLGQAVFGMQQEVLDFLYDAGAAGAERPLCAVTVLHQAFAIAFFVLAIGHAATMLYLYAVDAQNPAGVLAARAPSHAGGLLARLLWDGRLWWRVKLAALAAVSLPAFAWPLLHPATLGVHLDRAAAAGLLGMELELAAAVGAAAVAGGSSAAAAVASQQQPAATSGSSKAAALLVLGGLVQWAAVGAVVAFFATYWRDFVLLQAAAEEREALEQLARAAAAAVAGGSVTEEAPHTAAPPAGPHSTLATAAGTALPRRRTRRHK